MKSYKRNVFFSIGFILYTIITYGQPLKVSYSDSIYINVFSGTSEGKLHVSVKESTIYIRGETFDQEALQRYRGGDSTVSYDDIFLKKVIKIESDSITNYVRAKVNLFLLSKNWSQSISTGSIKETTSYNLNVQIWVSSYQLLIERGFYPVIGATKYLWTEEFSDFNYYLINLHRYLN